MAWEVVWEAVWEVVWEVVMVEGMEAEVATLVEPQQGIPTRYVTVH